MTTAHDAHASCVASMCGDVHFLNRKGVASLFAPMWIHTIGAVSLESATRKLDSLKLSFKRVVRRFDFMKSTNATTNNCLDTLKSFCCEQKGEFWIPLTLQFKEETLTSLMRKE